jgi:hypothetical protein
MRPAATIRQNVFVLSARLSRRLRIIGAAEEIGTGPPPRQAIHWNRGLHRPPLAL